MGKLAWYFNRLRAMSPREVFWRISQRRLQRRELAVFAGKKSVLAPLYPGVAGLAGKAATAIRSQGCQISLSPRSIQSSRPALADEAIRLPGGFRYEDYATDWHAGFNTPARWPLVPSYKLEYKQRDDIGDARINWELNRHRQFIRLAASGNIPRLERLVDDWAEKNPFLWGISWTSPMEIALRSISWMTAARLVAAGDPLMRENELSPASALVGKLLTGVANMTEYLTRHESGFSSANNHLIVEVAAVAMAGFLFGKKEWTGPSLAVLDRELLRQVSPDGVDLESSLHYHGFVFEAYLLVWREMEANGLTVSDIWRERLDGMARFIEASHVVDDTWCVFGDDDEARILDPGFGDTPYFSRLLDLHAGLSGRDVRKDLSLKKTRLTFPEGGYSFLRKGDMFVGIDHAPLGFGSIAAHGHNDILSFQLFLDGKAVLIDPGTYLYHNDLARRDLLRSTRMHNTVTVNGMEQSQMLGAFLWGKKAWSSLSATDDDGLTASVKGLSGVTHTRRWWMTTKWMGHRGNSSMPGAYQEAISTLEVIDSFDRDCRWEATFIVAPGLNVKVIGSDQVYIGSLLSLRTAGGRISTGIVEVAPEYGRLAGTTAVRIIGNSRENVVTLQPL